jgi:hypothetical protein
MVNTLCHKDRATVSRDNQAVALGSTILACQTYSAADELCVARNHEQLGRNACAQWREPTSTDNDIRKEHVCGKPPKGSTAEDEVLSGGCE